MPESREQRTERLLRDRDAARAAGRRVGGAAPYGWRVQRGELIQVPAEQAVRWLVLHLARQGRSSQGIADVLNDLAIRNRAGQRWPRQAVHRVTSSATELADTG